MAKYRVTARSFINNTLVEEGAIVEFDGTPSDNLEPMDKAAEKAAAKSDTADVESLARQKAAAVGADPNDPNAVAAISQAAAAAAAALGNPQGAAGLV